MAENDMAIGAILEIPQGALRNIEKAEKAIWALHDASKKTAAQVYGDFSKRMPMGVDAFIKKVKEAESLLGRMAMPKIDATSFSTSISEIAQAMATVDKSSTTGANRLSRIADSIAKLSATQTSAQMFQEIANGITAIGNTSQQTIANVSTLAQTMASLAANIRTVQNAQRAQSDGTATASQYNKLYKEQADLIRQMNAIKNKGNNATLDELSTLQKMENRYQEIINLISKLDQKRQTAASALADWQGQTRSNQTWSRTTVPGAINYAQQAKSLRELQDAYKNLKQAMSTVDPKSAQWQQMNQVYGDTKKRIDAIRTAMGELHNQSRQTGDMMGQLRNQIAAAFSVQAIMGFIKKMVNVRAEFELQNVALRAILQNKDEADRIFAQVQQMAMQSPFTIMQLNTYTKQLAAYRIESSKLLDTTKMLADVSAGLGTEMSRLVLAYGQVKSANYLRATEVRQFTEAGLNIAGELAQYFSELQGKMISVGDVMEMITKRMVRFEDVEEVFKRVTGAGGLFYDMQKKQSESLFGQIQRISDAYSIMMNEIGKSNEGSIKDVLVLIRELIQNWRVLVPLIKNIGTLMATVFIPKTIIAMVGAVHNLNKVLALTLARLKWITNASRAAWITTGVGAFIAIATTLFSVLQGLKEQANALNEELSRIGDEAVNDMQDSIAQFLALTKTITDVTKSYSEQQEALSSLTRGYGEYIDKQKLTSDYLKSLQGDYSSLTAEIRKHYAEIEYQNKLDAIINSDSYKDAQKQMREVGERMFKNGIFDESVSKGAVEQWMDVISKELAMGKLENSTEAIAARMKKIFGDSMGDVSKYMSDSYGDADFTDMVDKVKPLQDATDNLSLSVLGATNQQDAFNKSMENMPLATAKRKLESIDKQIQSYSDSIARLERQNVDLNATSDVVNNSVTLEQNNARISEYQQRIEQLKQQQIEFNNIVATKLAETVYDDINNGALEFSIQVGNNTKTLEINQEKLKKQLTAYFELAKKIREVTANGESYDGQLKELEKSLDDCWQSTDEMAQAVDVNLDRAVLDGARTTYDFKNIIEDTATKALPAFMDKAIKAFSNPQLAILRLEKYFANFAKKVNSMFGVDLFDGVTEWSDQVDKNYEAMLKKMGENAEEAADKEADSLEKFNDRTQKDIAKKYGVDASFFNQYTKSQTESVSQYADGLRKSAKSLEDIYKSYQIAVAEGTKESFLKNSVYTEKEVENFKNQAEALRNYANALYPEVRGSGGRGTDPGQKRLQLLKEINTEYEKLLKYYNKEEAHERIVESYRNAVAEIFKGQGKFGDIGNWLGFDKKSAVEIGEEMLKSLKMSPENRKQLQKDLAGLRATVDIEIQEKSKEKMQREIDDLMATYDLTKTFTKMGLSANLTNMFGKAPIRTAEELERKVKEVASAYKNLGTDGEKVVADSLKKIGDTQKKALEERAKNYYEIMLKSVSTAAQIQLKAQRELNETIANEDMDAWTKKQAAAQINAKMLADVQENAFKEFQSSDMYVNIFSDLKNTSSESLQYVIDKLKEMKEGFQNLPADQVRAIVNQLERAQDELSTRGGIKSMAKDVKDALEFLAKRNELQRRAIELDRELDGLTKRRTATELEINRLTQLRDDIADKDSVEYRQANLMLSIQRRKLDDINKLIEKIRKEYGKVSKEISAGNKAIDRTNALFEGMSNIASSAAGGIGEIASGLEMAGALTDELADNLETLQGVLGGVSSMLSGAAGLLFGPDPFTKITGAIGMVGGLFTTVGNLFASGDKKKEREIKRLQSRVEDLDRAYQKLSKSIEAAFTMDQYKMGTEMMEENINAQIKSYEEMIRLENDKKNSDKEKIREWKNAVEDLRQQLEDIEKAKIEAFGGFGTDSEIADAAEAFAEVWLDAFKETGDGLDALSEKWDEYIDHLILKQMVLTVVGKRIRALTDMVDRAVSDESEGGEELTRNELDQINAERERFVRNLNSELKEWVTQMGYFGKADTGLSDLQKGIQNITEPQAAAIEAYLNSMRFAVFRHTEQLDTLILAVQAQYGGGESPMLTEVRGIRGLLTAISGKLSSVMEVKPGRGTVLKVN